MAEIRLDAQSRSDFGKGAARRLRSTGRVPAVLYGDGDAPRHVSLDAHDLEQALRLPKVVLAVALGGTEVSCAPRDVQRDPVRRIIKHVDLVTLNVAEIRARNVEAQAVREAEAKAAELEVDPVALTSIVTELLAEGVDPATVVEQAAEQLEETTRAQAVAAQAAAAAEESAAESTSAEESAGGTESAE